MSVRQVIADMLKKAAMKRGYAVTRHDQLATPNRPESFSVLVIYGKKRPERSLYESFARVEVTRSIVLVATPKGISKRIVQEKGQYVPFSADNPNLADDILDYIAQHIDTPNHSWY